MGHKKVCFDCKTSFNRDFDSDSGLLYPCPNCNKPMILLPHRFRPPKKADTKKWATAKFLIDNGFYYHHIFDTALNNNNKYVNYPDNLQEAKEFVIKYKNQARQ